METFLFIVIVLLGSLLALVPIAYWLRPDRKLDVMQQPFGDFPRGGYAAMDERAPIEQGGGQ